MTLCQLLSHFPSASFSAEIKSTPSFQLIQSPAWLSADFKCGVETGICPNGPEAGRSTGCFYIKWVFFFGGGGAAVFGYTPTGVQFRQQIQTLMGFMSAQYDANWLTGASAPLSVLEQVRGARLAAEAHLLQGTVL